MHVGILSNVVESLFTYLPYTILYSAIVNATAYISVCNGDEYFILDSVIMAKFNDLTIHYRCCCSI